MIYDYIIVGGGLTGTVVASRIHEHNPKFKVVLIEAGSDPLKNEEIIMPDPARPLNLIGGDFDWNISTVPQKHANGRVVSYPQGKGLGGGTIINASGWLRGDRMDYDAWAAEVGDKRWGYEGQLPFMRKSEKYPNTEINPDQHGYDGPIVLQTSSSIKRAFPLREKVLQSWSELGVKQVPHFDGNAGNQLGVADICEGREKGRRQIAPDVYSLEGVTVLMNTLVEKVVLNKQADGSILAAGVKLGDGTELQGSEVILAAGAIRTPQLLLLSGIGPTEELQTHDIETLVDAPQVGKNLIDHTLFFTVWKVKHPEDGWAIGSRNPLFTQAQYSWGAPCDFIVTTSVPKDGLEAAIEADEGVKPNPTNHPLLKQSRPFLEYFQANAGAPDGSVIMIGIVDLHQTSRGNIKLDLANITGTPLINPNYLETEVDRFVHRKLVRQLIDFAASDVTVIGREILDGEIVSSSIEPLSTTSSDEAIDERIRASIGASYHPHGTAAMGKVVDTDLRVKGVKGLRVVDASVIPVNLATHLQVPLYALAEQAASLIVEEAVVPS